MYWIALFENLSRVNGHLSQLMEPLSMFLFPPSLSFLLFISLLYYNRIVFKLVIQAVEIYSNCKEGWMKVKLCQYLSVVSNWENVFDWCSGEHINEQNRHKSLPNEAYILEGEENKQK